MLSVGCEAGGRRLFCSGLRQALGCRGDSPGIDSPGIGRAEQLSRLYLARMSSGGGPSVVSRTTSTVGSFTTVTTVAVPAQRRARPVPLGDRSVSVDLASADAVGGEAPSTPNSMMSTPFAAVFDPADEANQSEAALGEFLVKGGCRIDNWDPDGLAQLGHELEKGEATLGRDEEGSVKRVVSVAKPVRPAAYFLFA